RLADGAAAGRRRRGSATVHRGARVERLYRAPDGSRSPARLLRRVLAGFQAGVRLRVAARRLSVDGHLGREPQPSRPAVEWPRADPRPGVRRLAVPGAAAPDGRARIALRDAHLSLA